MKPVNLQGHSRPIKKVKFNENGELLYTASSDRTIISWSIPKGEKLKTYTHSAAINTFCVTNKYLISGDNTGTLYIWDIPTEKILKKLEHDPTLSVRSLDFLLSDQSQIMIVYAGRGKLSKSFISIYNINDILNYGEAPKEEKKEEVISPQNPIMNNNNLNNTPNLGNANNAFDTNNNNNFKKNFQEKSIYDDENSIYSIYANKPKQANNQGNNFNNYTNQQNFSNPNNNYNFGNNNNQYQQANNLNNTGANRFANNNNNQNNNSIYNFNTNNNSIYDYNNNNPNSIYGGNQGNFRNNNTNNNQNFNQRGGNSIYGMANNNFPTNNFNNNNPNSIYNRNTNMTPNLNNNFNPRMGNNFDPNPAAAAKVDNTAKVIVSYEKVLPMKQMELPGNETKYVMAKFFPFNDSICIAVTKENGYIEFINYVSSKKIHEEKLHDEIIFDFDFDTDKNIFLSVSKDGTATVFDFEKYAILKKFKPENPVRFLNSCRIYKLKVNLNPIANENNMKNDEKVIKLDADAIFELGVENGIDAINLNKEATGNNEKAQETLVFVVSGGQDSKLVTTTKEGGFEILGYVMEEEKPIFSHLANFGPVNTIDLSQKNNYFASGAEDSTVKILNFDFLLTCNK